MLRIIMLPRQAWDKHTEKRRKKAFSAGGIDLSFTVGGGDSLLAQWPAEAYNMTTWKVADSSSLMVCVGPQRTSVASTDGEQEGAAAYLGAVRRWREQTRQQQQASCLRNFSFWTSAALSVPASAKKNGTTLRVDLSHLTEVRQRLFERHFILKTRMLPRQARDKLRDH